MCKHMQRCAPGKSLSQMQAPLSSDHSSAAIGSAAPMDWGGDVALPCTQTHAKARTSKAARSAIGPRPWWAMLWMTSTLRAYVIWL